MRHAQAPRGARTVAIDAFPEAVDRHPDHALVAVDVIRATTTAVTAVAMGCAVHPVASIEASASLAGRLDRPLLIGELGGGLPHGFHAHNSPTALAAWRGEKRPVILLSTSGTPLICHGGPGTYVASLRNFSATARHLAATHRRVALIGAGARGESRPEDELCCGWIAALLLEQGFEPETDQTRTAIERWRGASVEEITASKSVDYLRDSAQLRDLDFVIEHVDDLDLVVRFLDGRLVAEPPSGLAQVAA